MGQEQVSPMRLRILRGTNHIGGSITEITCGGARLFIDLGAMLPPPGQQPAPEGNPGIEGLTCGQPAADAVFFTHIHGDHIGLARHILPGVPLYLDEVTLRIWQVVDRYTERLALPFTPLRAGQAIPVGPDGQLRVTPFFTDHSSFRASMFLVEGGGRRLLHTGDFRDHGRLGAALPRVLARHVGRVDALVCEGTLLGRPGEQVLTESALSRQAGAHMRAHKLVFALQASTNIDRILSLCAAALRAGKLFLVDEYQHEVLKALRGTPYAWLAEKARVFSFDLLPLIQKKGAYMPLRKSQLKLFRALAGRVEGCVLYSQWEGYKTADPATARLLAAAEAQGYPVISLHTSGHATADAIQRVCAATRAGAVVPIHTQHKHRFGELIDNAVVLEDGEGYAV